MKYKELEELLKEVGYDTDKTKYLVDGFRDGFSLGYDLVDTFKGKIQAPNLKLRVGDETELWNKVMKEVQNLRYAGPFKEVPYDNYIQSPIGLVPKDNGKSTRLIFHLSYPRKPNSTSINANTPKDIFKVVYPDFSNAIIRCLQEGRGCFCGKYDFRSAFRNFPLARKYWKFLIMKARNPTDGQWYYFLDKCMPFGSSISCAHFQAFSDAIAFVIEFKSGKVVINYLDDFLFIHFIRNLCNDHIAIFLRVGKRIGFPVAMDKTFWASTSFTFLGFLIDTIRQIICIADEKICKAITLIEQILSKKKRKAKVEQVQKLAGFLNFLCRCFVLGRAFTMHLYAMLRGKENLKPFHHVKLSQDTILDLSMWLEFLNSPICYSCPFMDFAVLTNEELEWYTDAAKAVGKGFGGYHWNQWFAGVWDRNFLEEKDPSIEFLELYAVTIAVLLWTAQHKNKRIVLFCDNSSVVHMINKQSSKCRNCMTLIRVITLESLTQNTRVYAKHVSTEKNEIADALSRNKMDLFWSTCRDRRKQMSPSTCVVPPVIADIMKFWID